MRLTQLHLSTLVGEVRKNLAKEMLRTAKIESASNNKELNASWRQTKLLSPSARALPLKLVDNYDALVLSMCRTSRSGFTLTVKCRESPLQTLRFSYCSLASTAVNIRCQTSNSHTPLFAR